MGAFRLSYGCPPMSRTFLGLKIPRLCPLSPLAFRVSHQAAGGAADQRPAEQGDSQSTFETESHHSAMGEAATGAWPDSLSGPVRRTIPDSASVVLRSTGKKGWKVLERLERTFWDVIFADHPALKQQHAKVRGRHTGQPVMRQIAYTTFTNKLVSGVVPFRVRGHTCCISYLDHSHYRCSCCSSRTW